MCSYMEFPDVTVIDVVRTCDERSGSSTGGYSNAELSYASGCVTSVVQSSVDTASHVSILNLQPVT